MKKRICIDANSITPKIFNGYLTGVGRTTHELINRFDQLNESLPFEVILYFQNRKKISASDFGFSFDSKQIYLPVRSSINKALSMFSLRTALTKADLWHCPHNSDYVDCTSKTIFTIHDLIILNCEGEFQNFQVEKVKRELPPLLQQCKGVITCSESSKKDIVNGLQIDPKKIHVTHWGVDHSNFKQFGDKQEIKENLKKKYQINNPYFFSVSCGYKRKNTLSLLRAYEKLLKQNPTNDLVIIWKNYGADVDEIRKNSKGRILILDSISDKDLAELYNGSTASFYPSIYEGFGLPVLEAMACGIPVVTCKNSSLPEVGGDIAIYSESPEYESLYAVMEGFEENKYDIKLLGEKGIVRASDFTWEKCAKETIKIYSNYL